MFFIVLPPLMHRFNYDPDVKVPPKQFEDPKTNSTNQYKYFKRPIIPFLPQMPPNVILAPTKYMYNYTI